MTCFKQHLSRYLEGQGHSMTLQQNCVRPMTLLCEVVFYKYLTEMITIFGWHVSRNILVATLKVNVTGWPCSKIVSGPYFCYLKSDFTIISHKWSPYSDDMSRVTFWSLPWRSMSQHDLAAKSCPAQNFEKLRKTQKYMFSKCLLRQDVVRVFVSSLVLVFVRAILSWCP